MNKKEMIEKINRTLDEKWELLQLSERVLGIEHVTTKKARSAWCAVYTLSIELGIKK